MESRRPQRVTVQRAAHSGTTLHSRALGFVRRSRSFRGAILFLLTPPLLATIGQCQRLMHSTRAVRFTIASMVSLFFGGCALLVDTRDLSSGPPPHDGPAATSDTRSEAAYPTDDSAAMDVHPMDAVGPGVAAAYVAEVLADAPVAYFRLEETSGTSAHDEKNAVPGLYSGAYATYDGRKLRFFLDGVLSGLTSDANIAAAKSVPLWIGRQQANELPVDGAIDGPRFTIGRSPVRASSRTFVQRNDDTFRPATVALCHQARSRRRRVK